MEMELQNSMAVNVQEDGETREYQPRARSSSAFKITASPRASGKLVEGSPRRTMLLRKGINAEHSFRSVLSISPEEKT